MYFYLYKITNKINNKVYLGIHQTKNLDDGYFGSGVLLNRAIKKYGKHNFIKEILEHFDNRETMVEREKELVNSLFVSSSETYNILEGGHGSFSYINSLPNQGHKPGQQKKAAKNAGLKHKHRMLTDLNYREHHTAANSLGQRLKWSEGRKGNKKGNTVWVSHFDICKSYCIPFGLYPHYYDQGWIKGRKFNQYNLDRNSYKKRN